jgi:hypothetical protein
LHYRRAAEEFKTIGKYIIKAPIYKGIKLKELSNLYVSKLNETVCNLRKNHMHHYLFKSLDYEFIVPNKNSWDIHPFNFVNPKKTFVVLAESDKSKFISSYL